MSFVTTSILLTLDICHFFNSPKGNIMSAIFQENFIIEDLTYIPLGQHNPMFVRPYTITASASAVQTIADRYHDNRTGKITGNMIHDVAGEMIQPSANGIETVVNRDWVSTQRYIFIMKVSWVDTYGQQMKCYIQGFTEYDGISNSGNIDNNMQHYVNSVIETFCLEIPTPHGIMRREKLMKFYNVISNRTPFNDSYMFTQRPIDLIENIDLISMKSLMDNGGNNYSAYNMNNYMSGMESKVVGSQVDNAVPTTYLAKILNTGVLSNKSRDIFTSSYSIGDSSGLEGKIPEPSVNDNRFMKYLSTIIGTRTVQNTFTFNALFSIDNTIYNRFKVIQLNKNYVDVSMSQTPDIGEYWHGQDPVTLKAYSLLESAVAMVTKYGFSKMIFTATNTDNPMGLCNMYIMNFFTFLGIEEHDQITLLEMFKAAFEVDVFMSETVSSKIPLHAEFYVDLMGTSKVFLQYAGYPGNWYTAPTGANSFFNPVVTYDQNALDYSTQSVMSVIDTVANQMNTNVTYY